MADSPAAPLPTPRWFAHRNPEQRDEYAYRFVKIAEGGDDIDGEARFIDAMADRGSTILDAGCGVGRVAAALARVGHRAAGVDVDPILIGRGREFYPGLPLAELDLAGLDAAALAQRGLPTSYDVIVSPGNVFHFVAEGTQPRIVANLAGVLRPGGRLVVGFHTGRDYTHDLLDGDAAAAGLVRCFRFATWQLDEVTPDSDWAVSVYRRP
ncbi:MAG: class I SAM-dependent methyltransferase [Gemmatimonadetes bacterium]|nr:class I SAM-dependent methyltransferase [Gemmatimonadota bacterium]